MSNLMHKIRDAVTGHPHHDNQNRDTNRSDDTYGGDSTTANYGRSGTAGSNTANYGPNPGDDYGSRNVPGSNTGYGSAAGAYDTSGTYGSNTGYGNTGDSYGPNISGTGSSDYKTGSSDYNTGSDNYQSGRADTYGSSGRDTYGSGSRYDSNRTQDSGGDTVGRSSYNRGDTGIDQYSAGSDAYDTTNRAANRAANKLGSEFDTGRVGNQQRDQY